MECFILNEMVNSKEALEQLSLFLYTMQNYERITTFLPISEGLRSFDGISSTVPAALNNFEQDSVAIDVRLMLQRKYFSYKDAVQIRKLAQYLKRTNLVDKGAMNQFDMKLDELKNSEVELSLQDGTIVSGQVSNIEDATYGTLLHADRNRAERLVNTPGDIRLLALSPFVIKREDLLFHFRDLCLEANIEPLCSSDRKTASILRWLETSNKDLLITNSPFWTNVVGHNASEEELDEIVGQTSNEDKFALLTAMNFLHLLLNEPLDIKTLRKLVKRSFWKGWKNFEEVAKAVRAINNPGISSYVEHAENESYARIKILPNVDDAFIVTEPQLIHNPGACIYLVKRAEKWKVYQLQIMR